MDPNRMTEKAQDAVRQAQNMAQRQGQSQIDAEHLGVALLSDAGGVAARVVEKAGANVSSLVERLHQPKARKAAEPRRADARRRRELLGGQGELRATGRPRDRHMQKRTRRALLHVRTPASADAAVARRSVS